MKIVLFSVFLYKSHIVKILTYILEIGQNALSQWDCRVFKSNISLEQIDKIASSLAY